MSPESIGLKSSLVLGKHSGKHAFKEKLKILGYEIGDNFINEIFDKFKQLADKKRMFTMRILLLWLMILI